MNPSRFLPVLVLALLSSCASPDTAALYKTEGKTVYTDIPYSKTNGEDVLLDIYLPSQAKDTPLKKSRSYPVIVWIHGGGWRWGSKDHLPVQGLTDSGFAVVSINYRLDGHAKYPAQIDDCRAALSWLKKNGSQYHLNSHRIGLLGASAGGHLAALLGTTGNSFPDLPEIKAVCALYPPTDLITVVKEEDRNSDLTLVALLLGGPVNKKMDLAREGSPIRYVSHDDPPFFIIHGNMDTLVPVEQSQNLHKALLKAGVSSELKIYPDEKHGFYPDKELTREIAGFFQENLGP